jgi:hypothetical protein
VGDQLKDSVTTLIQDLGVGFGIGNFAVRVIEKLRERAMARSDLRQARSSPLFVSIMETLQESAGLDELSQLPLFLGLELRALPPEKRPLWLVFVDTYEHINGNRSRKGERELQRMVIELPDVLWVFTGRQRLDWADPDRVGALDRVGPRWWPGLDERSATPRQHLVGDLSDTDAHRFLERSLDDLPGGTVPSAVTDVIVRRAAGWPLYLDAAVQRLRELAATGMPIDEATFDVNFAALVDSIMRDLSDDDGLALRWACVFPRFSPGLIASASSHGVPEGAVLRLRRRGLLLSRPWPQFPLTVHDALRHEIRQLEPEQHGLTEQDWRAHARLALDTLEQVFNDNRDRDARIDTFNLAMSVALESRLEPAWLIRGAGSLPSMHDAANATPAVDAEADDSWAGHLAAVLACWTTTPSGASGAMRADLLQRVVEDRDLPERLRAVALRFRAYSLRNHGHEEAALEVFDGLIADEAPSKELNLRQRCYSLGRLGRFREIGETLSAAIDSGASADSIASLEASVRAYHGGLAEALSGYETRVRAYLDSGRLRLMREIQATMAVYSSMTSSVDQGQLEQFRDECAAVAYDNTYRTACSAVALASAGTPSFPTAVAALDAAYELPPPAGENVHTSTWRAPLARVFDAAVRGDLSTLDQHRLWITTHRVWWVITSFWRSLCGADDHHDGHSVDWIEPVEVVAERWRSVVTERRGHVGRDQRTGNLLAGG